VEIKYFVSLFAIGRNPVQWMFLCTRLVYYGFSSRRPKHPNSTPRFFHLSNTGGRPWYYGQNVQFMREYSSRKRKSEWFARSAKCMRKLKF